MAHGVLWLTGEPETGILNPDIMLPVLLYPAVLLPNQLPYTFTCKVCGCLRTKRCTIIYSQAAADSGRQSVHGLTLLLRHGWDLCWVLVATDSS